MASEQRWFGLKHRVDMTYLDEYGIDIDDEARRVGASNRVRNAKGVKPAIIIDGTPSVPVLSIHNTGEPFP